MDQENVNKCAKPMDSLKYEDPITPLWAMVEQRARIVVRTKLGTNEVGAAETAVKKAYVEALDSVIDSINGDITADCFGHLRANLNTVRQKISN